MKIWNNKNLMFKKKRKLLKKKLQNNLGKTANLKKKIYKKPKIDKIFGKRKNKLNFVTI